MLRRVCRIDGVWPAYRRRDDAAAPLARIVKLGRRNHTRSEDDRVVRERRIRDHEGTARVLQGLQQAVVVLVDHARVRAARQIRVRRFTLASSFAPLEPRRGLGLAQLSTNKLPQSFILGLVRGQGLL